MATIKQRMPPAVDFDILKEKIDLIQNKLDISDITARVLINRGILNWVDAHNFLNPSLEDLFDPYMLYDMDKAVERIKDAKAHNESITIYGDYDVDGMTGCALLYSYLIEAGCKVNVYIPNRMEGYGINYEAIEIIHARGTELLISVDCGTNSVEEVEYAHHLGMDVIITDHHQCGPSLPGAVAVINPARNPKLHNTHPLAGVGVVGKLVQALAGVEYLKRYLDLIALGTIADVVPLIGDNRIFAAKGLNKINKNPCAGIKALIEVSGFKGKDINSGRIAFGLAPRLNAAGRIDDPIKGFKLLSSRELSGSLPIAKELDKQNKERQSQEAETIQDAEKLIKHYVDLSSDRIIVLAKEGWNPGIIGIAASKIAERYFRPCILIALDDDIGTGSARSIKGFNIYEALSSHSQLMDKFGGHEQAAGLTIAKNKISSLKKGLISFCNKNISDDMLVPRFIYDAVLNPGDINYELVKELEAMEPFGMGNPTPIFLLPDIETMDIRPVGSHGEHLKSIISIGNRRFDGIAFGMGAHSEHLSYAGRVSVLAGLEMNYWKGRNSLQFNIKYADIVFKNAQDWHNFFSLFYLKYFDAFMSDFIYNKECFHFNFDKVSEPLPIADVEEIIYKFSDTKIGTLVLVDSLIDSEYMVKVICENKLEKGINFYYGKPSEQEGIGANTVIFAPIYSEISFSDYKNIYVFRAGISFYYIADKVLEGCNVRIIKHNGQGLGKDVLLIKDRWVGRSDFTSLYRWLVYLPIGSRIWDSWSKLLVDYQKQTGDKSNCFKIMLIVNVFKELDFLKIEASKNSVRILMIRDPKPRKLEESRLFTYYQKWINAYKEYLNFKEEHHGSC